MLNLRQSLNFFRIDKIFNFFAFTREISSKLKIFHKTGNFKNSKKPLSFPGIIRISNLLFQTVFKQIFRPISRFLTFFFSSSLHHPFASQHK